MPYEKLQWEIFRKYKKGAVKAIYVPTGRCTKTAFVLMQGRYSKDGFSITKVNDKTLYCLGIAFLDECIAKMDHQVCDVLHKGKCVYGNPIDFSSHNCETPDCSRQFAHANIYLDKSSNVGCSADALRHMLIGLRYYISAQYYQTAQTYAPIGHMLKQLSETHQSVISLINEIENLLRDEDAITQHTRRMMSEKIEQLNIAPQRSLCA